MTELDISLLDKEQLADILKKLQQDVKEKNELLERTRKENDEKIQKLNDVLKSHQENIEKIRYPGIDKTKLPSNLDIAKVLRLDPDVLEMYYNKNPDKYLLSIEGTANAQLSYMQQKLKDAEVDISGKSIIEMFEESIEDFWNKYDGSPETIDKDFITTFKKVKDLTIGTKKQFVEYMGYLTDVTILQDVRLSGYFHYRDKLDPNSELIAPLPDKDEKSEVVTKLLQTVEELKKEIEDLKENKQNTAKAEASKIAEVEQKELVGEELNIKPDEETPLVEPTEDKPKTRSRPRGI